MCTHHSYIYYNSPMGGPTTHEPHHRGGGHKMGCRQGRAAVDGVQDIHPEPAGGHWPWNIMKCGLDVKQVEF